jgi:NAD(P)-dependent dehydrogenase (short-subunit alcohol dehydrogenase family)
MGGSREHRCGKCVTPWSNTGPGRLGNFAAVTEILSELFSPHGGSLSSRSASLAARTMVGRNGRADDFRGVAVFLASPAAAFVTGQAIFVDGGFSST